jgi:endonuclease/exonuclease/phosphatase family metal-dependent hydrolase
MTTSRDNPSLSADRIYPARVPVLRHGFAMWRWFRRLFSRRNLSIRLLNLPVSTGTADEPGLLLLQIDGLSQAQLQRGIEDGRMPFLRQLIKREGYRIHPMYSGQPATTPAVLGELFYGVRQAVPAYSFRDHRTGRVVEMVEPSIASVIQAELEAQGEGLLQGGSAYSDIYSGGAAESHFCPSNMTWTALEDVSAWRKGAIYVLNIAGVVRMFGRMVVDLGHAVWEVFTSRIGRRELVDELKFVPRRLIGGVAIRDLVTIATEIDVTRGLPAIHANFVGYDELAHRRGPQTAYAHRGLPEIDRALKRIWNAAVASGRRDYHIWFMADHGQETTTPYSHLHGRSIGEAVTELYREVTGLASAATGDEVATSADQETPPEPMVVAIGPVGYVYWPSPLSDSSIEQFGALFNSRLDVPIVMARTGRGVIAWYRGRPLSMPDQAAEIFGVDHPHLDEVSRDFTALCDHPDAGEFVICGFRPEGDSVSFVSEHGAHGGPGPQETTGFLMAPADDARSFPGRLRPETVRQLARQLLQHESSPRQGRRSRQRSQTQSLRIATYNVHSCIGLDGRLSPTRIARVLSALDADVIALQELDVCRQRSGCVDQARYIADLLEMDLHFHPCIESTGEKYGNAVLSRWPMRVVKAGRLPALRRSSEPRGVLWVQIDCDGRTINLMTTHLSFDPRERRLQVQELLGSQWLEHPACTDPLVVCGDFNAGPGSEAYRRLTRRLRDVQLQFHGTSPRKTWFSPFPLTRIDHILVGPRIAVKRVAVADSQTARVASDHLPLAVELEFVESSNPDGVILQQTSSRNAARSLHAIPPEA